jgi:hypothetical protein
MAIVVNLKPLDSQIIANEFHEEWLSHKRHLTFQKFISERMPLFFGPLASGLSLSERIKNAERHLDIRFTINKEFSSWTGGLFHDEEFVSVPIFPIEDDLRLFLILLHLKLKVTKKAG